MENLYHDYILNGSDEGVQHLEMLDFWTLSIIQYSKKKTNKQRTQRFGN
jgi:hypothetical protein